MAYDLDSGTAYIGDASGSVQQLAVSVTKTFEFKQTFRGAAAIISLCWSPQSKLLVAALADKTVAIYREGVPVISHAHEYDLFGCGVFFAQPTIGNLFM